MVEQDPGYAATSDAGFEASPIGEYLRRQRILRGMSTQELADLTRIPLRSLERLESGQFDGETDGFVRGFVRTVAAALGLDTDDTVARMLHEPPPGAWERRAPGRFARQVLAIGVLIALLVCLGLVLRAVWDRLLGDAATPASREVVVWHDPVRALAAATGAEVDPRAEIDPGASRDPGAATPDEAARPIARPPARPIARPVAP